MKLGILSGIIGVIDQIQADQSVSTNTIEKLQTESNRIQKEKESLAKEVQSLKSEIKRREENNLPIGFISKLSELKNSKDFDEIYNFFVEISEKGTQQMMSKACEEGLWKRCKSVSELPNVLHEASFTGNLKLVKSLIESGCDKHAKCFYGYTPLICASRKNNLEVVKYLISAGANKDLKDNDGRTPLIHASWNGHLEVVKYLISVGANKEVMGTYSRDTAFFYGTSHLEIVKYFISIGEDKEARNGFGGTPLIWATISGRLEVVKYLISIGANKDAKDNEGNTPLINASLYGHLEVVKYLISAGANKEAKRSDGKTALSVASGKVREYLLSVA
ncbi:hypothetical protein TVAG_375450 [Trichomonas vaginalis G3]|uniref:Uncharacterized protein n=1 Tax=Trichomonas vaginalis (strain ATCC PRA-98 / G3) TaxID=412133 RepID=A2G5X2_TRIV3|nr:spectrin binding [Trichomonas vaginalis G3]EAX87442.1 hypothetical protein TVAG_375450 [Trichomonas vaginalis G3]KAI5553774.1 spectrin binding [Trichomonas vaginalis G3]|eukprot:XP_001300372.1 hypothetical protein [Trichomonas vaginalis G3]